MAGKAGHRAFGSIRKLPSGRYQVRYRGPDGAQHSAKNPDGSPLTFTTKARAESWLQRVQVDIEAGRWEAPPDPLAGPRALTFATYAQAWVATRTVRGGPLATRTVEHYQQLLRDHINPVFGHLPLDAIRPPAVRDWHTALAGRTGPTALAHTYGLLRSILKTAAEDDLIDANPCRIRGAGQSRPEKEVRPATLAELARIIEATPEPRRLMVELATWAQLRYGELCELRRGDVEMVRDEDGNLVRVTVWVRRAVVRTKAEGLVAKKPKSEAGVRRLIVPPHLNESVEAHLRHHVRGRANDLLLFPGADPRKQMAYSTFWKWWNRARTAGGRPDLDFHDLRHTGLTMVTQVGATQAETMRRGGHSTPQASARYQHATDERDAWIAEALSRLANQE